MIERILDDLLNERKQLSITLKMRNSINRRQPQADATKALPPAKTREITFPGNTVQEARKFSYVARTSYHFSAIS